MDTNSLSKTERAICPQIQREMYRGTVNLTAVSNSVMEDSSEGRGEKVSSLVAQGDRGSAFRWMGPGY